MTDEQNSPAVAGPVERTVMLRIANGEKFAYKRTVGGGFLPSEDVYKQSSELQMSYDGGRTWESIPQVWIGRFDDA